MPHPEVPISTGDDAFPIPDRDGPNPVPTDAREMMLAEMARAFNIGLGLNGLGASSADESGPVNGAADTEALGSSNAESQSRSQENEPNPSQSTAPPRETASRVSMPPEGSFERFLVDLQLDLRVALTHVREEALGNSGQNGHATNIQSEQGPEPTYSQSHGTAERIQSLQLNSTATNALIPDEAPSQGTVVSHAGDTTPRLLDAQGPGSESDAEDYEDEGMFCMITHIS